MGYHYIQSPMINIYIIITQRMTRLLNDSKLKVYGEEGEEVYLNMRVA